MSFSHDNHSAIADVYDAHCLGGLDLEAAIDRALETDGGERESLIASVLSGSNDEAEMIRSALAIILNGNSKPQHIQTACARLHKYGSRAVRRTVVRMES